MEELLVFVLPLHTFPDPPNFKINFLSRVLQALPLIVDILLFQQQTGKIKRFNSVQHHAISPFSTSQEKTFLLDKSFVLVAAYVSDLFAPHRCKKADSRLYSDNMTINISALLTSHCCIGVAQSDNLLFFFSMSVIQCQ